MRIFEMATIMAKDYIAQNDAEFLQQLLAFETALPSYSAALGITAAQISAIPRIRLISSI
jgi:hypothetical protein